MDERIAWGLIPIKEEVFSGETVEDWYSLTGKQGEDKEGMINLVFAYRVHNKYVIIYIIFIFVVIYIHLVHYNV